MPVPISYPFIYEVACFLFAQVFYELLYVYIFWILLLSIMYVTDISLCLVFILYDMF